MTASDRLVMRRPDDWHVHLRDGAMLRAVLPATARTFARAVVMPNLRPPVTSVDEAIAYRARILEALPEGLRFEPLMTAYLTDAIDPGNWTGVSVRACSVQPSFIPPMPPPIQQLG